MRLVVCGSCGVRELQSKGVARHQDYVFGVFIISAFFAFSTKKWLFLRFTAAKPLAPTQFARYLELAWVLVLFGWYFYFYFCQIEKKTLYKWIDGRTDLPSHKDALIRERMPDWINLPKRWKTLRFLSAPEVAFGLSKKSKSFSKSCSNIRIVFMGKSLVFQCLFSKNGGKWSYITLLTFYFSIFVSLLLSVFQSSFQIFIS